jgi:cellulose synthase/poly-beta-1,6-N-acetylglucosamine synthase-like glycosyltransferase
MYTVLVPLHREAHMVSSVVRALDQIDYPADKLDIKLILEETDPGTIAAARGLRLDDRFDILVVPKGKLQTKPRACNYALRFARGEFLVIFDAEDRPEPDQLKKAIVAFRRAPEIACLQARLAFYNAQRNWLANGIMAQTPLEPRRRHAHIPAHGYRTQRQPVRNRRA